MIRLKIDITDRPNIPEIVNEYVQVMPQLLGKYAVQELQGPGSDWPVRTGFSRASFGYAVHGERVEIVNSADYAEHVEERTGAAEDTLDRTIDIIAENADKEATESVKGLK